MLLKNISEIFNLKKQERLGKWDRGQWCSARLAGGWSRARQCTHCRCCRHLHHHHLLQHHDRHAVFHIVCLRRLSGNVLSKHLFLHICSFIVDDLTLLQGRMIAFNLCRNIGSIGSVGSVASVGSAGSAGSVGSVGSWDQLKGDGQSWCDNRIFNYQFQPSLHCPCFSDNGSASSVTRPPFKV